MAAVAILATAASISGATIVAGADEPHSSGPTTTTLLNHVDCRPDSHQPPGKLLECVPNAFTISPSEGPPGTVISAASITPCPKQEGLNPRVVVVVGTPNFSGEVEVPVSADGGQWHAQVTVRADQPEGQGAVSAQCVTGELDARRIRLIYSRVPFNVTQPPVPPAPPAPPTRGTPRFTG